MTTRVHLDGRVVAEDDAKVSIFDRSFLYGDSVYETLRTYRGVPFDLPRHQDRLESSMRKLQIDPGVTREELAHRVSETLAASGAGERYVRIIVTRGTGEFGLTSVATRGALYVIVRDLQEIPEEKRARGIDVIVAKTRRNPPEALDPSIKSGNYLNNLLAILEARAAGAEDALLLNMRGMLAEASTSNVFVVHGPRVATPPLSAGILDGVTRHHLLQAAAEAGTQIEERDITPEELRSADEVFLTGSLKEVLGVRAIDGVSTRTPARGPVTDRLHRLLRARIERG